MPHNKMDLLAYAPSSVERCIACARRVDPQIAILEVSATTGRGPDPWYGCLRAWAAAATMRRRQRAMVGT